MSDKIEFVLYEKGQGEGADGAVNGAPVQSGDSGEYITVNVEDLKSEGYTEEMIETSLGASGASSIGDTRNVAGAAENGGSESTAAAFAPVLAGVLAGVLAYLAIRASRRKKSQKRAATKATEKKAAGKATQHKKKKK